MRDKREVPGQHESARPGQRITEWPSVGSNYSTNAERKTRKANCLFTNLHMQIKKNDTQGLHLESVCVYPKSVTAKSVTRFDDRKRKRRTSAPDIEAGAFFCACSPTLGRLRAWETFGSAGSFFPGSSTHVPAATPCLTTSVAVPKPEKGTDMNNPLVTLHQRRGASQRAMALAALRSNSSLAVRRNRYNQHMSKARAADARARQYGAIPTTEHTHPETRETALSLIEPRLDEWRENPEPAEGRELIGLICMASALGALSLQDQARIVTNFQPKAQEVRHA